MNCRSYVCINSEFPPNKGNFTQKNFLETRPGPRTHFLTPKEPTKGIFSPLNYICIF